MKQLRVLQVGCGSMSRTWLTSLAACPDAVLVGTVDLDAAAAARAGEAYGLDEQLAFRDLEEALLATQPDVVFNCTVPDAHHAVSLAAFHRGCHVLSEKPLAASMAQARELVAAAAGAGVQFAVIQNRRYLNRVRRLRSFLGSGSLGTLTEAHSDFFIGAHFGGFRDQMSNVLLLDMAIHTFDMARYLLAADPLAVTCVEWNPPGSWYRHGANAVAIFEMTGGITYSYRGSWCAEGRSTTWEADWRIHGTKGGLTWDGADSFRAEAVEGSETVFRRETVPLLIPPTPDDARGEGHPALIRDFLDCVREGRQPETHGADNLKSLTMVFGAIESARTGRRVTLAALD